MRSSPRLRLRRGHAAALALILCAIAPSVAQAGTGDYTVSIGCQDGRGSSQYSANGWYTADSSRWDKTIACGSGGLYQARNSLTFPVAQTTDIQAGWSFYSPGSNIMRSALAGSPDAQFASDTGGGSEANRVTLTSITAAQVYARGGNSAYNLGLFTNLLSSDTLGAAKVIGCSAGSTSGQSTWAAFGAPSATCTGSNPAYNSAGAPVTVNIPGPAQGHVDSAMFLAQCPSNNSSCVSNASTSAPAGMVIEQVRFGMRYTYPPEVSMTAPATVVKGTAATLSFNAKSLVGVHQAVVRINGSPVATSTNPNCGTFTDQTIATYAPCVQTGTSYVASNDVGRVWNNNTASIPTNNLSAGDHPGQLVVTDSLGNTNTIPFTLRVSPQPICSDGIDNDGDGRTDAADPACHSDGNPNNASSYTPNASSEAGQCGDGADNDGDGGTDTADPACHSDGNVNNPASYDNDRTEGGQCGDLRDNNGDGIVDAAQSSCHTDGNKANGASYDPNRTETAEPTGGTGGNGGNGGNGGGGTPGPTGPSGTNGTNGTNGASGNCGDGKDNDGDGKIDADQPSCHTDGVPSNTSSYDPTRNEQANPNSGSQKLVECSGRKLVLIDVLPLTRTVQLFGATRLAYAGQTVSIYSTWNNKRVADVVVNKDGTFSKQLPLPPKSIRFKSSTRYEARIGSERSLRLKLFRYTGVNALRVVDGKVSITGRLYGRYVTKSKRITLMRLSSCKGGKAKYVKVGNYRVTRGSFKITAPIPANSAGEVFRTRASQESGRSVTFSLPKPLDL